MISKALKTLPRKVFPLNQKENPTKIEQFTYDLEYFWKMEIYYPVRSFFSRYRERISRSFAFAVHGWMHYDFESAYLYDLMAFKLKRIYECLKNGHAVQHKEDMDALREAIKICERLFDGQYDAKYYKAHAKKWGKLRSKHIPEYDENGKIKHYLWDRSRGKAKTNAQKKKEVADLRKIWVLEEKDRRADLDRLNEILKKHEPSWWD